MTAWGYKWQLFCKQRLWVGWSLSDLLGFLEQRILGFWEQLLLIDIGVLRAADIGVLRAVFVDGKILGF